MILLDENIPESQRQLLLRQRIRARQIGVDVAHKGIADEAIIPLLLELRRPSFFTRDMGFFDRTHCHRRYCLVCMAVGRDEAAPCLGTNNSFSKPRARVTALRD